MSMIVFNKKLVTEHNQIKKAWNQLLMQRESFNVNQNNISAQYGGALEVNQAALISKDYWREVDNITTRVFRNDEGNGLLDDLLGLGTPISIGKTAALYRVSSDAGKVHRTLTGHVPEELDKVIYDEAGDPIPIFNTGYSREWREWNGMQSENLDAMADDQEAHVAAIREDMADYMLSGDAKVKVKGYVGAGITNHANTNQVDLSASGLNIDLTTSTPDESVAFFTGPFAKLLDDNYVQEKVKVWASPDIMRNLNRPYSDAAGFKEGTVLEYILRYGRIESFNQTFKLTGNHFIAYVRNSQYIKTRIAAPVGAFMIPRQNPFDNYNTLVWSAVGLQIKRDFNGRSKVFNAQG